MQVSMEKTGDLGRKLTVAVPSDAIDGKVSGRLNEMRGQVRLKGFRPGKVPMNVLRQRYGQQVREEVTQQVMQTSLQDAISEQKLRVASVTRIAPVEGNADDTGASGDFSFEAELEVFPELPDIDVSTLEIEKPVVNIEDEDVDQMIETLREQRRSWSDTEKPAEEGDRLQLEFVATVDNERIPAEGARKVQPVLGGGVMFEAFEQALAGLEAGAEKTVDLEFPDDFADPALAGKNAQVELKVHAVEHSEMPAADDEFAKSFGIEGGIEQMRTDVRKNLEREMRSARTSRIKQNVSDKLAEQYSDFALPAMAVQQELEQMQAQLRQQYGEQIALPEDQMRPGAERRVRLGFLLAEIARQQSLEIDDSRVQAKITEIAETYENPAEIVQYYQSNPQLLDSIQNMVLEEQVMDWVLDSAKAEDKPMSFKELMEPQSSGTQA